MCVCFLVCWMFWHSCQLSITSRGYTAGLVLILFQPPSTEHAPTIKDRWHSISDMVVNAFRNLSSLIALSPSESHVLNMLSFLVLHCWGSNIFLVFLCLALAEGAQMPPIELQCGSLLSFLQSSLFSLSGTMSWGLQQSASAPFQHTLFGDELINSVDF